MCGKRHTSTGQVTQYEIEDIKCGESRGWQYVWASVSSDFHPQSYEHFLTLRDNLEQSVDEDEF